VWRGVLSVTVQRCCVEGCTECHYRSVVYNVQCRYFGDVVCLSLMLPLRCACVQQAVYQYDKLADRKW
jgi:hypothetical protein